VALVKIESVCRHSASLGYHVWFVSHHDPQWRWLGAHCSRCGNTSAGSIERYEAVKAASEAAWKERFDNMRIGSPHQPVKE